MTSDQGGLWEITTELGNRKNWDSCSPGAPNLRNFILEAVSAIPDKYVATASSLIADLRVLKLCCFAGKTKAMDPMSRCAPPSKHLLLPQVSLRQLVCTWLDEDTPSFDFGGCVVGEAMETAVLLCKSKGVLAGVPFFDKIFEELSCKVEWHFPEGVPLEPICTVAKVTGPVDKILLGERVALNCITRASGIATMARKLADLKSNAGWQGEIAGTRKTTPGFRMVEKYALVVGEVSTHRYDLSSMIMLKDNHIWTAGDIGKAVKDARSVGGFSIKIEVECRNIDEARAAANAGAEIVMLDNFEPELLHRTAAILKGEFPKLIIEASGGIREQSITDYFGPHIDVISMGSLTQGYGVVDFSLKIEKEGHNPHNPVVKELLENGK